MCDRWGRFSYWRTPDKPDVARASPFWCGDLMAILGFNAEANVADLEIIE